MKANTKIIVVALLIVATVFMGVFQNERQEQKRTIQTGAATNYDSRNWFIGSRTTNVEATANRYGNSADALADTSLSESQRSNGMADSKRSIDRGAGCITDITVRSGYSYYNADELAKGLLQDLVPLAPEFIKAQETYGIDAVFLAAVAAEESGWGTYQFRKNNIFGFENCDFDSVEQCIDYAASWLRTKYLTPGGMYYEGVGVSAVNKHYNGRATWEQHVTAIMTQIVARIESEED